MLVKVAYYASSIAFFGEIMLNYALFFSNYAPFFKIMLFEKVAKKSKKYIFLIRSRWSLVISAGSPSSRALQIFGMAWIKHGRHHFVICSLA